MTKLNPKEITKRVWVARRGFLTKWWHWLVIGVVLTLGVGAFIWAGYSWGWTGFNEVAISADGYERAKTLWNWMELLIVPAGIATVALWFDRRMRNRERKAEERRIEIESETERLRACEAALQTYLDRMELMLKEGLRTSVPDAEVREIARARTLSVLRQLDNLRKGMLLVFLHEARLIEKQAVIDLNGASLEGANLNRADLRMANLERANLSRADLREVDLSGANLRVAEMGGTNLERANLSTSDLSGAG